MASYSFYRPGWSRIHRDLPACSFRAGTEGVRAPPGPKALVPRWSLGLCSARVLPTQSLPHPHLRLGSWAQAVFTPQLHDGPGTFSFRRSHLKAESHPWQEAGRRRVIVHPFPVSLAISGSLDHTGRPLLSPHPGRLPPTHHQLLQSAQPSTLRRATPAATPDRPSGASSTLSPTPPPLPLATFCSIDETGL